MVLVSRMGVDRRHGPNQRLKKAGTIAPKRSKKEHPQWLLLCYIVRRNGREEWVTWNRYI